MRNAAARDMLFAMQIVFLELPGWRFDASEPAAGTYRLTASREDLVQFERTGADPKLLLEQCRAEAATRLRNPEAGNRLEPSAPL